MVVGGGSRTRRRGVRSRLRRRFCVRVPCDALGFGEQPALPAEVEGDGLRSEDRGEDARGAGQAPGLSSREAVVGIEVGCLHRTREDGVVDGDDHGGCGLRVQVVCGEVLEELGERESAAVPPVEGAICCLRAHPSGCGRGVDDLAEHGSGQGRDGEVAGGGAVTVVVQGQRALLPGGLLFFERMRSFSWASTTVLSGSAASIARRAIRRSWSGLNRAAFAISSLSTTSRCSAVTPCQAADWLLGRSLLRGPARPALRPALRPWLRDRRPVRQRGRPGEPRRSGTRSWSSRATRRVR